jgi:AraC-like DNA-binding protein
MTFWIMIAGAAQGFFLAALLAGKARRGAPANRILAVLIGSISVRLAEAAAASRWGHGFVPGAVQATFPLIFAFPPLLYLYVEALGRPSFRLRARDGIHALPFAAAAVWVAASLVLRNPLGLDSDLETWAIDLPWLVQAVAYSAAVLRSHPAAEGRIREADASPERTNIRWIRFLTWTFLGIAALVAVRLIGRLAGFDFGSDPRVVLYAAVALLIYLWGYRGLGQPEIFFLREPRAPAERDPEPAADAGRMAALRAKVLRVMETERPYLDPELSLHGFASRLDEPPHLLSRLINRELGRNFFTFINEYRVGEARRRLAEPGSRRLKLLALAMDCGFASKSAFNRVFKDLTGETPSEFQRRGGPEARAEKK